MRLVFILAALAILTACQSHKDTTDWKTVTQYVKGINHGKNF